MTNNMSALLRAMLLSVAACLPVRVIAGCGHSSGVDFCGPELISLLYVTGSGLVYVQPTSSLMPAPAGFTCSPVSGSYFVLDPKASNFKQIYAALLSARISGAPITLVADPAQPTCTILYITL
jgi:hypothetical protein